MKVALLAYHKNISTVYDPAWVERYKNSILNQTFKAFTIYEVNYGGGTERIFENSNYRSVEYPSFVYALNYLLIRTMIDGFDCVANSNVDDWYPSDRLEMQLPFIQQGYDIVSSNFSLVEDDKVIKAHYFENLNIALELANNHNVICHPSVVYSKRFLDNNRYVPEQQPMEDLMLWQRSIKNGYRFIILPETLCFHRLHNQSVCQSENR